MVQKIKCKMFLICTFVVVLLTTFACGGSNVIMGNEPMLTIIDDDGDVHFFTDLLPIIEEMDVPISTAVTIKRIGSSKRWMNWEQLNLLSEKGIEVLCHGFYHDNYEQVKKKKESVLKKEYSDAKAILKEKGFNSGDILVYTSSTGNFPFVRKIAKSTFRCAIKIGGNKYNDKYSDKYALSRYRIDFANTEGKIDYSIKDIKQYIDSIAHNNSWGIFMIHTSNTKWRCRVEVDSYGNIIYDQNGKPKLMYRDSKLVLDDEGIYPTYGKLVYLPILKESILYARGKGVKIVNVNYAYEYLYEF